MQIFNDTPPTRKVTHRVELFVLREFYNKISEKNQLKLNFRLFDEFLTNRVYIINAEDNAKFKWDFIRQGIDFHFFANKTKPFNRHRCLSLLLIDAHSHKTFLFAWLSVVSSPFICSIYWLLLNCQDARSAKRSNWWWWWWSFCRFWYQNSEKKNSSSILGLFLLLSQHVSCSIFFCIKKIIMALSAT